MISMPTAPSVPMVSQTEIDPVKTALSLVLALVTTTALAEPLPVPKPPGPGAGSRFDGEPGSAAGARPGLIRMPRDRCRGIVEGN